jgi:pimeloyl-ACP methyl ester carboxylesterase
VVAGRVRVIYLHGLVGGLGLSPGLRAVEASGHDVVAVDLPGFDGEPAFEVPSDYLDWLTLVWDRIDATGVLPCPIIGASIGGMLAADLAALRPEAVTALALVGPLGLWDDEVCAKAVDPFGVPSWQRASTLFAGPVPDACAAAFADRGPEEQGVAQHLAWVAAAGLVWPMPDHGLAARVHRIRARTLVVWGEADGINPVALLDRWPGEHVVVPGAGHLAEWDAPDAVGAALVSFLDA